MKIDGAVLKSLPLFRMHADADLDAMLEHVTPRGGHPYPRVRGPGNRGQRLTASFTNIIAFAPDQSRLRRKV